MSDHGDMPAPSGATAAAYIEKKWGGPTRLIPIGPALIGVGALRMILPNPRRMFWIVFNLGNGTISFDFTGNVSIATSPQIPALGGSVSMWVDEDGEEVTREVWLISAAGTNQMTGWEVIRK